MSAASPKWTVIVTDYNYPNLDIERETLARWGAEVVPAQCSSQEEVLQAGREAHALISQYAPLTAWVIASLTRCRALGRYGIGVDNIDVAAATARGIAVINVPSYCEDEVSDHALALLLAVARRVCRYDREVKSGLWDWKTGRPLHRLQGKTLGLLGFGKIARRLAEKAKALGLVPIAHDPYLPDQVFAQAGVRKCDLDALLRESDIISVHVPLTPETRHLLDARAVSTMKPGAILINTSRGPIVDEQALAAALRSGHLAGAGLDVMESEPPKADNPLLGLDRVVLTPHVAWYSEESQLDLRRKVAEDVGRALHGILPQGLVNRELAGQFRPC